MQDTAVDRSAFQSLSVRQFMLDPYFPARIPQMSSQPLISTYRHHFLSLPAVWRSEPPNPVATTPPTLYTVFTRKFPSQPIFSPSRVGEDHLHLFSRIRC